MFKIATDPGGRPADFLPCLLGCGEFGDTIYNPVKGRKERIGRILQMHANNREEIMEGVPATSLRQWG